MDWSHATNTTKKLTDNHCDKCRKKHDRNTADKLMLLITVIENSENFSELNKVAKSYKFDPHELENKFRKDYDGYWAYSINDKLRVILRPDIDSQQVLEDGVSVDFRYVTSLILLSIEDYHKG